MDRQYEAAYWSLTYQQVRRTKLDKTDEESREYIQHEDLGNTHISYKHAHTQLRVNVFWFCVVI